MFTFPVGFFGGSQVLDPFWNNVSLLLPGDGANGSTTIPDVSLSPKTVTPTGNTQISTAQSKFGGASIAFDGNGDFLSVSPGFNLSAGDWTIECWVYFNTFSVNTAPHVFSIGTDAGNRYGLYREPSGGKFSLTIVNSNSFSFLTGTTVIPTGQWIHVAIVSASGTRRFYYNGIQEGINSTTSLNSGTSTAIGFMQFGSLTADYLNGCIDDFRITTVARYTANFTPPTAPFPIG